MKFRILDLGAHDGFVTNFIARQARNSNVEVYVDGVEANPDGVRIFSERMAKHGLMGVCKQGLAEDAPALFPGKKYDAVVAFEIIEHAPIVEGLLDAAESMCRPGGRVYISTPNGTFGEGNNPHHLRTWTIMQLFELLRKRGRIQDVLPGPDGVSVISYTPNPAYAEQPEVVIYTGPGWEKWAPDHIQTKGLGGSETAAARLAEALSDFGCRVTVYGEVEQGAVGQVAYKHYSAFDYTEPVDILISSRIPEVFGANLNARKKVLWMHDTDCGPRLTEQLAENIDKVMVLSRWHERHVHDMYPFLRDKTYITRNGIDPSYFQRPDDLERNPHRALYTSSPDRGLDLLLELWPSVRERVPDAELAYAYASVYEAVAAKDKRIAAFRQYLNQLSEQSGVTNLGSLTQPGVAKEMMQSGVWLAPGYSTPAGVRFHETFCIGAVEAAAAGCKRVLAAWGALCERNEGEGTSWVGHGAQDLEEYKAEMADAIVEAMLDERPHTQSKRALEMDWQEVAADFLAATG